MFNNKILSQQNLKNLDVKATIKNIKNYFVRIEYLQWEWTVLHQKGLTANYDFTVEYKNQPYIPIGKDEFNLSAKEDKEEKLKQYIASHYWAMNILSEPEQLYINEHFTNDKYDDYLVDLLGFNTKDDKAYINLKKSAIYKFADFLNLIVEKKKK